MIGFFDDSGLSVQSAGITAMQATDGSSAAVDREVFIGVTDTDRAYFAASDPGVDDIMVSIVDAESGTSLLPSSLRMALDAGDLVDRGGRQIGAIAAGRERLRGLGDVREL